MYTDPDMVAREHNVTGRLPERYSIIHIIINWACEVWRWRWVKIYQLTSRIDLPTSHAPRSSVDQCETQDLIAVSSFLHHSLTQSLIFSSLFSLIWSGLKTSPPPGLGCHLFGVFAHQQGILTPHGTFLLGSLSVPLPPGIRAGDLFLHCSPH